MLHLARLQLFTFNTEFNSKENEEEKDEKKVNHLHVSFWVYGWVKIIQKVIKLTSEKVNLWEDNFCTIIYLFKWNN